MPKVQTKRLQASWFNKAWFNRSWFNMSPLQRSWLHRSWLQKSWPQKSWPQTSWLGNAWHNWRNTSLRSKPRLSIRARLIVVALLAIAPLMLERFRGLERTRAERVELALARMADLARGGAESQREVIYSVRALLQVVARIYAKMPLDPADCNRTLAESDRQNPVASRCIHCRLRWPNKMCDRPAYCRPECFGPRLFSERAAFAGFFA